MNGQPQLSEQPPKQFIFIPMSYTAVTASMAGNASTIIPIITDQDADFELHQIVGRSSLDVAADIRPNNFTFQIADKSNGRNWSDVQIDQMIIARSPDGWRMDRPVLIAAKSNLSISITNLSGSANIVRITLLGHKVMAYLQG